ncbi:hypothetical protein Q8A67_021375 [Cirrhinus molitorella]|uniref:Uncharacterized protein n=1 Tax=Cirrhinus molitorella TaxID=172907 RepID=A0AA88PBC7_9TELE|nr:hypothetical protein Q8A67_021375 [Cirrhinus molitorella]
MDCEDEHGGQSATGSKSNFHEDVLQNKSVLSTSEPSDVKDLESTTCLKEDELSPTDELSGKENSCLISPLSKSKPLPFDVHIKEFPTDVKKTFQNVLNAPDSDISDAFPVCVQLPTNHLKKSRIMSYKATHRHCKISRSSTSTLSLKPPVEAALNTWRRAAVVVEKTPLTALFAISVYRRPSVWN